MRVRALCLVLVGGGRYWVLEHVKVHWRLGALCSDLVRLRGAVLWLLQLLDHVGLVLVLRRLRGLGDLAAAAGVGLARRRLLDVD